MLGPAGPAGVFARVPGSEFVRPELETPRAIKESEGTISGQVKAHLYKVRTASGLGLCPTPDSSVCRLVGDAGPEITCARCPGLLPGAGQRRESRSARRNSAIGP